MTVVPLSIEPLLPSKVSISSGEKSIFLSAVDGDGESIGEGSSCRSEMSVAWESLWCRLCLSGVSIALHTDTMSDATI